MTKLFTVFLFIFIFVSGSVFASSKIDEYLKTGQALLLNEEYDLALKSFEKVIKLSPDNFWAYLYRGDVYAQKGEYDLSVEDYSKAISLNPSLCSAYIKLGKIYEKQSLNDKALAQYNSLIKAYPLYSEGFNARGELAYSQGYFDYALSDFDKAIELAPKNYQAYVNRGRLYLVKKYPERAILDFDKVISFYDGVPLGGNVGDSIAWAHYYKGRAYEDLGVVGKAADSFKSFLKCRPPEYSQEALAYAKKYTFTGDPLKEGVNIEVIKVSLEGSDNLLITMHVSNWSTNEIASVYVGKFDLYLDGKIIGRKGVTFYGNNEETVKPGSSGLFYLKLYGEGQDFRNWSVSIFEYTLNMK